MYRWVLIGVITVAVGLLSEAVTAEMPALPRGKGIACVAPTDVMRKDHMKFLLHQRDRTVYEGIRTRQFSLVECVDCHVQRNYQGEFIAVDAPDQFCEVCHTYTSVTMDCFECHATTPDSQSDSNKVLSVHVGSNLSVLSYRSSPIPAGNED